MSRCGHRYVKCPGLDCSARLPLSSLHNHVITCCVERAEIKPYKLPHKFTYMMNEDIKDLGGENQNFNWKLEGMKFEDRIFFLKVTRKARAGRWFFFVQRLDLLMTLSDTESPSLCSDQKMDQKENIPRGTPGIYVQLTVALWTKQKTEVCVS